MYPFIEGIVFLQSAEFPRLLETSDKAFGRFQYMLKEFPADTLYETIEKFHTTENRYRDLMKAIEADARGLVKEAQVKIDFSKVRKEDCGMCLQVLREGKISLWVTHNDTNLNNTLIGKSTDEKICVIDLDTVMLGLSAIISRFYPVWCQPQCRG